MLASVASVVTMMITGIIRKKNSQLALINSITEVPSFRGLVGNANPRFLLIDGRPHRRQLSKYHRLHKPPHRRRGIAPHRYSPIRLPADPAEEHRLQREAGLVRHYPGGRFCGELMPVGAPAAGGNRIDGDPVGTQFKRQGYGSVGSTPLC